MHLGPGGRKQGGQIIATGTPEIIKQNKLDILIMY